MPAIEEKSDFFEEMEMILTESKQDQNRLDDAKKRFAITDEKAAEWAVGKITMWQNEIERRKRASAEYIRDAEVTLDRLNWLFKEQLERWSERNLPKNKKSIKFKSGQVSFRTLKEKLKVRDEEALRDWAAVNCPQALKPQPDTIVMAELYKWREENGKDGDAPIPEGCDLVQATEKFDIK